VARKKENLYFETIIFLSKHIIRGKHARRLMTNGIVLFTRCNRSCLWTTSIDSACR